MVGSATQPLHPASNADEPTDVDWRAVGIEGIRAVRAIVRLAGEGEDQSSRSVARSNPVNYRVILLLIVLVSSPIACGASLIGWGIHENRSAADHARVAQETKLRQDARDNRIAALEGRVDSIKIDILKMKWTLDRIAEAIGVATLKDEK